MQRVPSWIIRLLGVIVVYGLLNVILVGGHWLWHYKDNKRRDQVKAQLGFERPRIQAIQIRLEGLTRNLDESKTQIEGLESEIHSTEGANPLGIPENIYDSYSRTVQYHNALVTEHNQKVIQQNLLYEDYSSRINQYNALVEEGNSLGKKIGGTWYVIPMPHVGTKSSAKAKR